MNHLHTTDQELDVAPDRHQLASIVELEIDTRESAQPGPVTGGEEFPDTFAHAERGVGLDRRDARRRRFRHQLVEAGERLGLATDIEQLPARDETVGSERKERELR